jgi:predicted AAA+ superfamily ATPase
MYRRPQSYELERRLAEPRRFIQIILGPRQVGNTTLVRQALDGCDKPTFSISADDLEMTGREWLIEKWKRARSIATASGSCVLSVDEIQRVPDWSSIVKRLWDEDTASGCRVQVVLTGSSTTLIRKGMSESLAGRFEVLRAGHWSWPEMRDAFGVLLDEYLIVGGYPGPMEFRSTPDRWRDYMQQSIIESTLALDVLSLERIDKPALLRNLFILGTSMSTQIVSLQKLLGQLQDSGNAATIAQYLSLLSDSGLLTGIEKYTATAVRSRAASPKLISTAPALLSAILGLSGSAESIDPTLRGQIVESAVGSQLLGLTRGTTTFVKYWREGNAEVDFVLQSPRQLVLIEVKSGDSRRAYRGAEQFRKMHGDARLIVVGGDGMRLDVFLGMTLDQILQ